MDKLRNLATKGIKNFCPESGSGSKKRITSSRGTSSSRYTRVPLTPLSQSFEEEVGVPLDVCAHDMDYVEAQKNYGMEEENEVDAVNLDEDDENIGETPTIENANVRSESVNLPLHPPRAPRALKGTTTKKDVRASLVHSYKNIINGFSALLTPQEADMISGMEGVISVFRSDPHEIKPHTTRSWDFVSLLEGTSLINSREKLLQNASYGDDIIVGVIDTGYEAAVGPLNETRDFRSPRDAEGHGTHTAGTVGGRRIANASAIGGFAKGKATGGAPNVRLAIYNVCWPVPNQSFAEGNACAADDILAAFDDAIADGVHVLSVSLVSVPKRTYYTQNGIALGSLHAVKKNVVVSCSAGNEGPIPSTVGNVAPWIITVGASSIDRVFSSPIMLGNGMIVEVRIDSDSLVNCYNLYSTEKNPMATLLPGNTLIGTRPATLMALFTSKGPIESVLTFSSQNISVDSSFNCPEKVPAASNLNYPPLAIANMRGSTRTVRRVVTNVGKSNSTYFLAVRSPPGYFVDIVPKTLRFSKLGEKHSFNITVRAQRDKGTRAFMVRDVRHSQGPSSGHDKLSIRARFMVPGCLRNRVGAHTSEPVPTPRVPPVLTNPPRALRTNVKRPQSSQRDISNAEFRQSIHMLAQLVATQTQQSEDVGYASIIFEATRVGQFMRMNPPKFTGTKVEEDHRSL
ncbi:hypothetical protein BC332_04335 [Capsicum chinense]|nr:hypothetical protein BC332_04335 [Capsicum chinense]